MRLDLLLGGGWLPSNPWPPRLGSFLSCPPYLVGVLGEGLGQARRGASGVAANGGVQLRGVATGEQRGDDGKADSDWRG